MKGAKKCIKLLILCITFLLSLSPSLNASAIEKIDTLQRGYVSSIGFNTYNPNNTYTGQTILNNTYSPLYQLTIPANGITRFSNLQLTLDKTFNVTSNHYYDITMYMYIQSEDTLALAITPMCPGFSNANIRIDECQIEYHDFLNEQTNMQELGNQYWDFGNRFTGYYAMTLKGHFTGTSSGSTTSFSGAFLSINNIVPLNQNINVLLAFSNYRAYTLKDDNASQDEVAQKELEDRDNLETQQSSTSTDSNSSQQQAQSTGTTLLAAFSSFVSAITSSSPSNCKINMDMGNLDLGLVDFCTLSPPAPVQTIASIFMILFCVPLSIATARKVISLFRSFQR